MCVFLQGRFISRLHHDISRLVSQLGELRKTSGAVVEIRLRQSDSFQLQPECELQLDRFNGPGTTKNNSFGRICSAVAVSCRADSPSVAFMLRFSLLRRSETPAADRRVLPTHYSNNYVTLLPGENLDVTLAAIDIPGPDSEGYALEVEGWNVPKMEIKI